MIEAVNSVVSNAPLIRGSLDQTNSARATDVEIEVSAAAPQAPFVSPYVYVDVNFDTAVLQLRDSDTGDVLRQFPSESTLEARRRVDDTVQTERVLSQLRGSSRDSSSGESQGSSGGIAPTQAAAPNPQAQIAAAALASSAQAANPLISSVVVSA